MTGLGADRQGEELDRQEWATYFDAINRRLEHGSELEATVEQFDGEIPGPEAEWLPLNSITYEDGDDEIAIGLGGRGARFPSVLWHFVDRPRRVWAHEPHDEPEALLIEDEEHARTLLRLRPAADR